MFCIFAADNGSRIKAGLPLRNLAFNPLLCDSFLNIFFLCGGGKSLKFNY